MGRWDCVECSIKQSSTTRKRKIGEEKFWQMYQQVTNNGDASKNSLICPKCHLRIRRQHGVFGSGIQDCAEDVVLGRNAYILMNGHNEIFLRTSNQCNKLSEPIPGPSHGICLPRTEAEVFH